MGEWQLPPVREGHAASDDLKARRERSAGVLAGDYAEQVIGGVRCVVVGAAGADRTLLYLHGGGYRMGSPAAYIGYAGRIAEAAGARVVMPFYRLAPENPFPAGLHDAVAVYRALAQAGPVFVGGDSAGGGLSASLCIAADAAGQRLAGAILLSPMLDLTAADETYAINAERDLLFGRGSALECAELYLQGVSRDEALVAPMTVDPSVFPPLLLIVGTGEVLLGEVLGFTRRLAMANRRITLHVAADMTHVWPLMMPTSHEAAEVFAAIGNFIRSASE